MRYFTSAAMPRMSRTMRRMPTRPMPLIHSIMPCISMVSLPNCRLTDSLQDREEIDDPIGHGGHSARDHRSAHQDHDDTCEKAEDAAEDTHLPYARRKCFGEHGGEQEGYAQAS